MTSPKDISKSNDTPSFFGKPSSPSPSAEHISSSSFFGEYNETGETINNELGTVDTSIKLGYDKEKMLKDDDRDGIESNNKINEYGRSMVEMLGVLAIIGVLSVGALSGYSYAIDKHRSNQTINEIQLRAVDLIMQVSKGNTNNPLSDWENTTQTGFPIGWVRDGNEFGIQVSNVPSRICEIITESLENRATISIASANATLTNDCSQSEENIIYLFFIGAIAGETKPEQQPVCNAPFVLQDGKCQCPQCHEQVGDSCIATVETPKCCAMNNGIWNGNSCVADCNSDEQVCNSGNNKWCCPTAFNCGDTVNRCCEGRAGTTSFACQDNLTNNGICNLTGTGNCCAGTLYSFLGDRRTQEYACCGEGFQGGFDGFGATCCKSDNFWDIDGISMCCEAGGYCLETYSDRNRCESPRCCDGTVTRFENPDSSTSEICCPNKQKGYQGRHFNEAESIGDYRFAYGCCDGDPVQVDDIQACCPYGQVGYCSTYNWDAVSICTQALCCDSGKTRVTVSSPTDNHPYDTCCSAGQVGYWDYETKKAACCDNTVVTATVGTTSFDICCPSGQVGYWNVDEHTPACCNGTVTQNAAGHDVCN